MSWRTGRVSTRLRMGLTAGLALACTFPGPAQAARDKDERNLVISAPAATAVATASQRVALVIGNGAYRDAPLHNPTNDARAMAEALKESGFTVSLQVDTDIQGMLTSIRRFGDQLRKGGVGVFYYAGHGMQIKGRNYLIPVNSVIQREDEVAYQAVDAQAILDKMEAAGNGTNIMILDACRNNPFARSFRSSQQGLAQMEAPVGTLVAFATAPGSVASDGSGSNGLYTQHLLSAMREPGAKVEDVFKRVRSAVRRESKDKQVPWEATSLEGDFYFMAPSDKAPSANAALEESMWALVKSSGDALDLKSFLARFPNSVHAAEALARLKQNSPVPPAPQGPTPAPTTIAAPPPTPPQPTSPPQPALSVATANPFGYSVGDRWSYQQIDKYKGEVISNWNRKISRILPNGDLLSGATVMSPNGNIRQLTNNRFPSRVYSEMEVLFPKKMETGHREDFSYKEQSKRSDGKEFEQIFQGTIKVKSQERIKVPAGEFTAFRVEREASVTGVQTNGQDRWNARQEITYWYVPALHNYVALEEIWRSGSGAPDMKRHELTSYEVRPAQLADKR